MVFLPILIGLLFIMYYLCNILYPLKTILLMKKLLRFSAFFALAMGLGITTSCDSDDPVEPLGAPTGLNEASISQTSATLTWNAVESAESYLVRINNTTPVPATSNTYTPSGLTAETESTWAVRAVRGDVMSDWSADRTFSTLALPPVPVDVPGNLNVTNITFNSATLHWDAVTDDETVTYEVRMGDDGTPIPIATGTSYNLAELDPETEYSWTVRTVAPRGASDWAQANTFTTEPEPINIPAPTNPVTGHISFSSARFTWDAVADATGYEVRLGETGTPVAVTGTSLLLVDLEQSTSYTWFVRSTVAAGTSPWSDPVTFTTMANDRGLVVVDMFAFGGTVRWNIPSGVTGGTDKFTVRVQADDINHTLATVLADGRENFEFTSTFPATIGASYGLILNGLSFQETEHTWQVRFNIGGTDTEWYEGPAFITPKAWSASTLTGAYSGNGISVFNNAGVTLSWTGTVSDGGDVPEQTDPNIMQLKTSNLFDTDGDAYLYYNTPNQWIAVDGMRPALTNLEVNTDDGPVLCDIYLKGWFTAGTSMYFLEELPPLIGTSLTPDFNNIKIDEPSKKLSFPVSLADVGVTPNNTIEWCFSAFAAGTLDWVGDVSDSFTNVTVQINGGSGVAKFSGNRIDKEMRVAAKTNRNRPYHAAYGLNGPIRLANATVK
jgi:hypothetical protein